MNKIGLSFRKGDVIAVALVFVIMISAWMLVAQGSAGDGAVVQIYRDGALVNELSLDEDSRFVVEGEYTNIILVSGGSVSIADSDCPGGDCVHSGSIDSVGRSIVCLPNRVEVRISGQPASDGVDFVVG